MTHMMAHDQLIIGGRYMYNTLEVGVLCCVSGGSVAFGEPLADCGTWFYGDPHNDGPRHSIAASDHACSNVAVSIGLAAARRTGR